MDELVTVLQNKLSHVQAELADLKLKQRELSETVSRTEQQAKYIIELLAMEGVVVAEEGPERDGLEVQVVEELTAAGRPLHYRELAQMLMDRGVPLPGKTPEANLVAFLSRNSSTFVRVARGTYALVGTAAAAQKSNKQRGTKGRGSR